jgi:hypothetical protein
MRQMEASRIMSRTTIDLDPTVLRQLKARQRREGKTLGRLVSELLSRALEEDGGEPRTPALLAWSSRAARSTPTSSSTRRTSRARSTLGPARSSGALPTVRRLPTSSGRP